jgi:hypothetical protein
MFDKIIPPEKGPATRLSRDTRKLFVMVFGAVGKVLMVVAIFAFWVTRFNNFVLMALCLGALGVGGILLVAAEYFRDPDES